MSKGGGSHVRVIIVGAGLGGPCPAQGLVKSGIEVAVYERDARSSARSQGYRLHIDGRGAQALHECLPADLYELFIATTGQPSRQLTVMTKSLKPLHTQHFTDPNPTAAAPKTDSPNSVNTSVDRSILRRILYCGLSDSVSFDREFDRYQQLDDGRVRAHFTDGSQDTCDVLVAADGVSSRIRSQYLPQAQVRGTGERVLYGRTSLTDDVRARIPLQLSLGFA
ncbi:MAG TPA: FAD-dependent monooxygenase [Actinocrinis sp.]|nr:FAD-dependent monooxygenase [Actinocrinis sp.]